MRIAIGGLKAGIGIEGVFFCVYFIVWDMIRGKER